MKKDKEGECNYHLSWDERVWLFYLSLLLGLGSSEFVIDQLGAAQP
jgi:hypothetical protein